MTILPVLAVFAYPVLAIRWHENYITVKAASWL